MYKLKRFKWQSKMGPGGPRTHVLGALVVGTLGLLRVSGLWGLAQPSGCCLLGKDLRVTRGQSVPGKIPPP